MSESVRVRSGVVALCVFCVSVFLMVAVAYANGDSDHTCEFCHPDSPTLCDSRKCASNEVCSGNHGTLPNGDPWVLSKCVPMPSNF